MGKKKDKKQRKPERSGYAEVPATAAVPATTVQVAQRAAVAQRVALAAFEAADEVQRSALEAGSSADAATDALVRALAALSDADAAADAAAAGASDAADQVEAALSAAARVLRDAQELIAEPAPEPAPAAEPVPAPEPASAPASVPAPALDILPNVSRKTFVRAQQEPPVRAALVDVPLVAPALTPTPVPEPALPNVSRETLVRDPGPSASVDVLPDDELSPGTLPMSSHELKERARADARAAKEQERAQKATAKRAAKDAKASKKRAASTPEAAPASAPATPATPAPAPAPAAAVPDYGEQSHAARNACIVLLLLLLAVAGLVAAAWLGLFRLPDVVQDRIDLLPDVNAVQGVLNAEDSPVAPGSYRLIVNQVPTAEAGARSANFEFENAIQNTYSARMDVYLDDTGQLVASTRMVVPGSYLERVDLLADLEPGSYQATAKVGVYSGATRVNTMSAGLELRIQG